MLRSGKMEMRREKWFMLHFHHSTGDRPGRFGPGSEVEESSATNRILKETSATNLMHE